MSSEQQARRKRKRSSSLGASEFDYARLTTEEKDAIEDLKMDNFKKVAIPESCEDASLFSAYQINTMKELGSTRYDNLCFYHAPLDLIFQTVLETKDKNRPAEIPFTARKSAETIKTFIHETIAKRSKSMADRYMNKSNEALHNIVKNEAVTSPSKDKGYPCMGIDIENVHVNMKGDDDDDDDNFDDGFKGLIRDAIRNKADELKKLDENTRKFKHEKLDEEGYLKIDETNIFAFLNKNNIRCKAEHEYCAYYFTAPDCQRQARSESLRCQNCYNILDSLRKRSRRRSKDTRYTLGMTDKYVKGSPARVQSKLNTQRRILKTVREKLYWTRKQYDTYIQNHGIKISSKQAELIFDTDTETAYHRILDAKNGDFDDLPQKDLISYLCKVSWENVQKAKKSGKKSVEFCPIVLKFAHYVKSQMNNSSYSFLANVFNLPSISTLNKKSAYDTNTEDGLMHETMKSMEEDFKQHFKDKEIVDWDRMGVLKFDEMKIKEKMD